jgi:acetolactate synthase I/II/III large subunit
MTKNDDKTITGGEIVVATLKSLGVSTVFAVPGGQTLYIVDAIEREPAIRLVVARHESAAASMADAYGRITRTPGVCMATTGPGATNLLTGVGGAFRDSSPVIVLTCNNYAKDLGRDDTQAADHVRIFESLTKQTWLVTETTEIARVLHEAYLVATTGCPGPVLVDLTRSVLEATVSGGNLVADSERLRATINQRPLADLDQVASAVELLTNAKKPVMWVGHGLEISGASAEALQLAEKLSMPAMTTFNSISALPSSHPLVFGPRSRMGTSLTAGILAEADLVLAVGNSLNSVSTGRWSVKLPKDVIQIDADVTKLGRDYNDRTVGLVGDARSVLVQLIDAIHVDANAKDIVATRLKWIEELQTRQRAFIAETEDRSLEPTLEGTVHPIRIIRALQSVAPVDTMLVVDAGNPGVWAHLWQPRTVHRYIKPVGFGNMGFGLPAGIAAKICDPELPVVVLVGDGSLGMSLGELETTVREHTDICVLLMNDGGYGNIRQEQELWFGKAGIGVDLGPVDYAGVARACGMTGELITDPDALEMALTEFFKSPRATLLDVRIDPRPNVWTYPLFADSQ